jgi:pilus assembly protein Flp/PilA
MLKTFKMLLANESGVTMIEYGLLAALVGVAAVAVLTTLGGDLQTLFTTVAGDL